MTEPLSPCTTKQKPHLYRWGLIVRIYRVILPLTLRVRESAQGKAGRGKSEEVYKEVNDGAFIPCTTKQKPHLYRWGLIVRIYRALNNNYFQE